LSKKLQFFTDSALMGDFSARIFRFHFVLAMYDLQ
jgi:hypothetical protein